MRPETRDRINGVGIVLRFITPTMGVLLTVISTLILSNVTLVRTELDDIHQELFHHLTNAELHVPRGEYLNLMRSVEDNRKERQQQIDGIRNDLIEVLRLIREQTR